MDVNPTACSAPDGEGSGMSKGRRRQVVVVKVRFELSWVAMSENETLSRPSTRLESGGRRHTAGAIPARWHRRWGQRQRQ
jgi:hypothetical protein